MLRAIFVSLVLPVIAIGVKRARERAEELHAAINVRSSIGEKRESLISRETGQVWNKNCAMWTTRLSENV